MKENNMAFNPQQKKINQDFLDKSSIDYSGDYSSQENETIDNQNNPLLGTPNNNENYTPNTSVPQSNYVRGRRFGNLSSSNNKNLNPPQNQNSGAFEPRNATPGNNQINQRPNAQPSQYSPRNTTNINVSSINVSGTQRFSQSENLGIAQQVKTRKENALNNFITAGAAYERSEPSAAYQKKIEANDINLRFSYWGNAKTTQPTRYPFPIEPPIIIQENIINRPEPDSFVPTRIISGFEEPLNIPVQPNNPAPTNSVNKLNTSEAVKPIFQQNRNSNLDNNLPKPELNPIKTESEQIENLFSIEKIIIENIVSSVKVTGNNSRFKFLPVSGEASEPVELKKIHQNLIDKIQEKQEILNIEIEKIRVERELLEEAKKIKSSIVKGSTDSKKDSENQKEVSIDNIDPEENIQPKKRNPNTNFKTKNIVDGSQFQTPDNHNYEGVEISDLEKSGISISELLNFSNIQINQRVRFNIQELSSISVPLLLEVIGATCSNKNLWQLDQHLIETQDNSFKWFNKTTNKGSTGSINLMKHLIAIENKVDEDENNNILFRASCQRITSFLPELFALHEKKVNSNNIQQEEDRKEQNRKLIKAIDSLPLLDIMHYFQGKNHHKGISGRWKVNTNGHVYSINNGWYSFTGSIGGHGAINFTAHVIAAENNLDYNMPKEKYKLRGLAINLLKNEFKNDIDLDGNYDDVPIYSGEYKVPFSLPLLIPQKQTQIRNYLHEKRGLPYWIINKQMAAGVLFPGFPSDWKNTPNLKDTENLEDKYVWAVFLAMNGNGAEMRAIDRYDGTAKLQAKGSEKEAGGHLVKAEKELSEGMVCSFEAAIDACSYASIFPGRVTNSCMGVNYNLAASIAVETLESGYKFGCCFDNDLAGNTNTNKFNEELIKRIGQEEYNEFYNSGKLEHFQLGILCLKEQVSSGQRFYFDVNYDVNGKKSFKIFHEELVKDLGLAEVKRMYNEGNVFAYNITPSFDLIKDENLEREAIKTVELLLNEKKPIYFVTEKPMLDKSEAHIDEKVEEHQKSLMKHAEFMHFFKQHMGNNYSMLQKKGAIIKNISSFAKDWNEYLNKMKNLYPEFEKQQQDFEDKFAEIYPSEIKLELVAGKIKKKL